MGRRSIQPGSVTKIVHRGGEGGRETKTLTDAEIYSGGIINRRRRRTVSHPSGSQGI
jgi:hypothetical protein